jgi:TRAP-type C4-dicarboxylate transport system permease small subunit
MKGIAAWFFGTAVLYVIVGMSIGIDMAMSQNHAQMPTHAHINLIGWVSFALFAFFYHLFPARAQGWLAMTHFAVAQLSFLVLVVGLYIVFSGDPEGGEALAAPASMVYLASMVLFAVIAWPVVTQGRD